MRARMMWTLIFAVAVVTAACGDSKSSLLPTAPTSLSTDATSVEASGATAGYSTTGNGPKPGNGNGNNGNGNGNGQTPSNTSPAPTSPVAPGKSRVQFEGLVEAVNLTERSIKVSGQVVMVTDDTLLRRGNDRELALGDIHPTDRVHVVAKRVEAGLIAEEIRLQNPGDAPVAVVVEPDQLVSVSAVDKDANESGAAGTNNGTFRLTRAGSATQLANGLTVSFTLGGTATAGDYVALPLTAAFAANAATADVTITPVNDGMAESPETVVLTVSAGANYELGSPASATLNVTDDPLPLVSVSASRPLASEGGSAGRVLVTRNGNLTTSLTVYITLTGTAENGVDYQALPTTLVFTPGVSVISLSVVAGADLVADPSETVVVTVLDGDLYDLGAVSVATVSISGS